MSIKKKKKIYNKFYQAKDPDRIKSLHKTFKKHRYIIANLIRTSKDKHYKNYFQWNKNKFCKIWQGLKQALLIKKTNGKQLNDLKVSNMIVNDIKSITSEFNELFGSVAQGIDVWK